MWFYASNFSSRFQVRLALAANASETGTWVGSPEIFQRLFASKLVKWQELSTGEESRALGGTWVKHVRSCRVINSEREQPQPDSAKGKVRASQLVSEMSEELLLEENDTKDMVLTLIPEEPIMYLGTEGETDFQPGGIHCPKELEFWEKVLKSPTWVMTILHEGYSLPFISEPTGTYEEDNNHSAVVDEDFVRQEVSKWERQGVVEFVKDKPTAVSPLTVAKKINNNGSVKKHLCWDGSHYINPKLKKEKVCLLHLQAALEITRSRDWQAKYDLANAFFHIKIKQEHQQYLGAKFKKEDGSQQYFRFWFMPFRLATAVYVITKIMKLLQAFFNQSGIRHTIFINDERVLADSEDKAKEDYRKVRTALQASGWRIAEKKSDMVADISQFKEYLGFIIDWWSMTVHLTPGKKHKLVAVAGNIATS
jgi:hypothetical protein